MGAHRPQGTAPKPVGPKKPDPPKPTPPDVPEPVRNACIESTYNRTNKPAIPDPKDYGDNTPQYTPTMTVEEYVAKKKEEAQAIIEKYYCSGEADNIGEFDPNSITNMPFFGDMPSAEEVFEPVTTIGVSLGLLVLLGIITIGMAYTWSTLAPVQQKALGDLILEWLANLEMSSSKEQEKDAVIPKDKPKEDEDDKVYFPLDPSEFNPNGLAKNVEAGTFNGSFIFWKSGGKTVFRWDENSNRPDGPHYHIPDLVGPNGEHIHFYPGAEVPEPYATIYFGGK